MDRNPAHRCLVDDKGLQLRKGPAMECCALRPASRYPRANMRQILQRYRPLRAFGLRNNPFGEVVVYPCRKAVFLPYELSQAAAGTVGPFPLELAPQAPMPIAHVLDRLAGMGLAVAIYRNIGHPQVNAHHAFHVARVGYFNLAPSEQIPRAVDQRQIRLAPLRSEQRALPIAAEERDRLPPVERPDRDFLLAAVEGQDAIIVGHRTVWAKRALNLAIQLVGIRYLRNAPHHHLRGKPERLAGVLVHQLVNRKLPKGLGLPCRQTHRVTRLIRPLKRALQSVSLLRSRLQLQLDCEPHNMRSILHSEHPCNSGLKPLKRGAPPTAKARGFPRLKASIL